MDGSESSINTAMLETLGGEGRQRLLDGLLASGAESIECRHLLPGNRNDLKSRILKVLFGCAFF
jgi:hypothetical protein